MEKRENRLLESRIIKRKKQVICLEYDFQSILNILEGFLVTILSMNLGDE